MSTLLADLTEHQRQAVTHCDGPCLVVAGAGTGKTMVITRRIAYLIEQGVAPDHIVALTFTDKAAREMEERVDTLLPYGVNTTTIATFHSFCADLFKRHAFLLGLDPASRLLTTADEISFLRQHLSELPTSLYRPSKNPVEFLKSLIQFISKAKDEALQPETIIEHARQQQISATTDAEQEQAAKLEELGQIFATVQQLYADHSLLSYADLIAHSLAILRQFPSARAEEQKRLSYLLVDEFQDTNYIQNEVANLLVKENQNIMAVGDDDQAIYSFRGANLGNILQFTTVYPHAKKISLADNFRSTQPILDCAYRLIQHNNPERLEVQEKVSKQLISHKPGGIVPQHLHFERSIFEYTTVAEQIRQFIESGQYQPEEIAVLVRAKSQIQNLQSALASQNIPYQYSGDSKFYTLPLVQAATSYLRFLTDPYNDLNLFFCLSQPPFSIKEQALQRHTTAARYHNTALYDYLLALPEGEVDLLSNLQFLSKQLETSSHRPTSQIFLQFLHDSELYQQVQKDHLATETLATLYEEIVAYENSHPGATLPHYITHLDYLLASDEEISLQQSADLKPEGVQILTIHKSKGLEFPVVFVINLVQGRFPSRNYSDSLPFPYELTHNSISTNETNLQEERRLAYVAFTRAKERLFLTSSELYDERKTKAKLSPFVIEALGLQAPPTAHTLDLPESLQKPLTTKVAVTPALPVPPTTFSPSALETYQSCPKQYEYQYVLKIKVPASHLINFGISVHETLRSWFLAQQQGKSIDLEALYQSCWVKGGYENQRHEQERYQEGLAKLRAYLDTAQDVQPVALEQSCKVRLQDGTTISGKIDRIDRLASGRVKVLDYKTGEVPKKAKDLLQNIPLGAYLLSLQQAGQEVEEVELQYLMVGEKVTVKADQLDLEGMQATVKETVEKIHNSLSTRTFTPNPDKILCSYCEYRSICPFRWGK